MYSLKQDEIQKGGIPIFAVEWLLNNMLLRHMGNRMSPILWIPGQYTQKWWVHLWFFLACGVTPLHHICLKVVWHKFRMCRKSLMVCKSSHHYGPLGSWIAKRSENYDPGLQIMSVLLSPEEEGLCGSQSCSTHWTSKITSNQTEFLPFLIAEPFSSALTHFPVHIRWWWPW